MNDIKQDTQGASRVRTPSRSGAAEAGIAALLAVLSSLFGLAPWLMTGAQLPLQNLWATTVLPEDMPVALLPLSQYQSTTILALLTVGGALAGLSIRLLRPAHWGPALGGAAVGLLLVQVSATVQAFTVLGHGLSQGSLASLYFAGLLAGTIVAMAASLGAVLMIAAKSRVVTAFGIGLMAVPAASWLAATAAYIAGPGGVPVEITMAWRWLPAILVGLALAWCGLKPASRLWIWAANLALLWLVPAVFTAINSVLGTRVLAGNIHEMLTMGRNVLGAALGPAGGAGPLVLVAFAVGLGGVGIQQVRRKQATTSC